MSESSSQDQLINSNIIQLTESHTLAINEASKRLQAEGKKIYRFGLGQSPFPVPEEVVEALRKHAAEKDYLAVQGLPALRDAVANFHKKMDGVEVSPNNVIIGPGSKELLFLLQLVFKGKLLVVGPSWVSYVPQGKILAKEIGVIQTRYEDQWVLTPETFENYLKITNETGKLRLLVLNYPGNPDGVTYKKEALVKIAALAREHNIYILSDEIYGQLNHDGNHTSIAQFYPEGTIISSGLSKWCGAGGWRLGSFSFPDALRDILKAMCVAASETYTSVCAPIQYAAITAYNGSAQIDKYLLHSRRILKQLGNWCYETFTSAGIKMHQPLGGFYLFLDFSAFKEQFQKNEINGSEEMCSRLLKETGVAILPGSSFNIPDNSYAARLAYVDFDGETFLNESAKIPLTQELPSDYLKKYSPNIIEGCEKMVQWVQHL